jgi:hypothetical protein
VIEVFPYGKWNGDRGEHLPVAGKLATREWIAASKHFEEMPGAQPLVVDEGLLRDGVYTVDGTG